MIPGMRFHDHFTIKGVISLWGGISDTSFISPHDMLKTPVLLAHSMDDAEIPFERASHKEAKQTLLLGSKDIARRFDTNGGCYQLYFVKEAGHGYGFSSDYISNAVKNFADGIREGKCNKLETENRERNIAISLVDSDEALFPDEDNRIIKLPSEKLQDYAGKYNYQGNTVIMTVEGDHLKVQPPGPQTFDIYPLSENIFLDKLHNFRIEFVRDPDGRVKEHIYRPTRFKAFNFKKIE